MSETAIVEEIKMAMTDETVVEPAPVIDDDYLRELALKLDPFIAVGQSVPMNLARSGYLADMVEKLGWDDVLAEYPEARGFMDRLRTTLEDIVAGV